MGKNGNGGLRRVVAGKEICGGYDRKIKLMVKEKMEKRLSKENIMKR